MTNENSSAGNLPAPFYVFVIFFTLVFSPLFFSCASQSDIQAEEFFSIGMAYYEMGKFAEAEKWLSRAGAADKTMTASEYNLGRIAFETGRYEDACRYFERILEKDPDNVMALKAAAYSRIKNGNLEEAENLYNRVLALVPESADAGFNYALVLYSLEQYDACEQVLNKYPFALEENPSSLLLFARAQKAQNKTEAADTYAKWAASASPASPASPEGLREYAEVLEGAGLFVKALEQYKAALDAIDAAGDDTGKLKKSTVRFYEARLILTADPENAEGMTELSAAVDEGFSDIEAMEELLDDERISQVNRDEIRGILNRLINAESGEAETETPAGNGTAPEGTAENSAGETGGTSGDSSPEETAETGI